MQICFSECLQTIEDATNNATPKQQIRGANKIYLHAYYIIIIYENKPLHTHNEMHKNALIGTLQ